MLVVSYKVHYQKSHRINKIRSTTVGRERNVSHKKVYAFQIHFHESFHKNTKISVKDHFKKFVTGKNCISNVYICK